MDGLDGCPVCNGSGERLSEDVSVFAFTLFEHLCRFGLFVLECVLQLLECGDVYCFCTALGEFPQIVAGYLFAVIRTKYVSGAHSVFVSYLLDEREQVICQLFVPSVFIPPFSGFCSEFREH